MRGRDFLYPTLPRKELGKVLVVTLSGALFGGLYGVLHDQVTFRISEEYFTQNKFDQFHYARPANGSELNFVSRIGFLATWWMGLFTAWALSRVSVARAGCVAPFSQVRNAFTIVFAISALVGCCGWLWGQWRKQTGYAAGWIEWMESLGVRNEADFMTVGYIHNASYLGGLLGIVFGILYLIRQGKRSSVLS